MICALSQTACLRCSSRAQDPIDPTKSNACDDLPPSLALPHQIKKFSIGQTMSGQTRFVCLFCHSASCMYAAGGSSHSCSWSSDRLVLNSRLCLLRSGWAPLWGEISPDGNSSPPPASSLSRSAPQPLPHITTLRCADICAW